MKSLPGNACRGSRRAPLWLRAFFVFVCANFACEGPQDRSPVVDKQSEPVNAPEQGRAAPVVDKRLEPVNVPDSEKPKRTAEMLVRGRQALKETLEKLEEARNSRDVARLNCILEKLTEIKGLLRVIEDSDVKLQEALANKDSTAAEYEFTKARVADERLRERRSEVEQCIGQLAYQAGAYQSLEVIVPENLAGDDVTNPPKPPPVLVRPPPASPM